MSVFDYLAKLWKGVKKSPAVTRARVSIPRDRVDDPDKLGAALTPDGGYFLVNVNSMYLRDGRQWFTQIDPMVVCATEFTYGPQKKHAVPFVVGPSLTKGAQGDVPAGMMYVNTCVAGPYPYRGGPLALSVILYQVTRQNYADELLALVERAAGALDVAAAVGPSLKLAEVLVGGVQALFRLGGTRPLAGLRRELKPSKGALEPGYFALIDLPEGDVAPDSLWVRDDTLVKGATLAGAEPFRDADYVLYSVTQDGERHDVGTLPFYPLWERALREAGTGRPDAWKNAKYNLVSLCQEMRQSPDLTHDHCTALIKDFKKKARAAFDEAVETGKLAAASPEAFDAVREEALKLLKL